MLPAGGGTGAALPGTAATVLGAAAAGGLAASVAAGGVLLYASMYLLGGPMTGSMTTMGTTGGAGTNAPLFYTGLGLLTTNLNSNRRSPTTAPGP